MMKKILIIALTFMAIGVHAQETTVSKKEIMKAERAKLKTLDVEKMASIRTQEMTESLKLTKEQEAQVYALNLEDAKVRKALIDKRSATRSKKAVSNTKRDEFLTKRMAAQEQFSKGMKNILTTEQFEKWQSMDRKHDLKKHKE